jgi:hypothetical protein
MENMEMGLTAPKWVLIVWPKIPQIPQNLFAQFDCTSSKVLNFNEKRLLCKEYIERRHGEPFKFLFLPKMGLLGSQAVLEKKVQF